MIVNKMGNYIYCVVIWIEEPQSMTTTWPDKRRIVDEIAEVHPLKQIDHTRNGLGHLDNRHECCCLTPFKNTTVFMHYLFLESQFEIVAFHFICVAAVWRKVMEILFVLMPKMA